MSYSLGILIVGALLWEQTKHRKEWRRNRLDWHIRHPVFVPIRYGRKSSSRGYTYTMVFSRALENDLLGCAFVVPCTRKVTSAQDLVEEAEHLWVAERPPGARKGEISGEWGCVGLLVNPDSDIPVELLQGWSQRVKREQNRNYGQLDHAPDEPPAVNEKGILQIIWPSLFGGGSTVQFDLLLATATKPTLIDGQYATAEEVTQAWIEGSVDDLAYFRNNREHGITTFQDDEITNFLGKEEE